MEGAKVVNMSPNKTNVRLSAVKVADAADALSKLDWLVKLVQEKKHRHQSALYFCNVLTDIAQVLSYLLLKLGDSAYITCNDKKQWLLAVYHSQTWEETKSSINNDFKIIDLSSVRIVIATTSLSMGVNFQDVRYIIHFLAPARALEDYVQQLGRAGRDGNQSHDISFVCNQNLKDCENDIKKIFKSQNVCLWVSVLKSFDENVISLDPKHNCCSACASSCNCNIETGLCDSLKSAFDEDKKTYDPPHLGKKRSITDSDKQDFKAALLDEQDRFTFAEGGVSIFSTETLHGFSDQLAKKCIENLDILLTSRNILELLPLYSVKHARIILELLQEFFNDIPDFETEINILCEAEIRLDIELEYLTLMELFSENDEDESETYEEDIDSIDFESDFLGDDDILPEFELRL